jgi:galactose mutarotase-like enzyme
MTLPVYGVQPDGREVHVLTLGAQPGVSLELLTLGACVHRLEVTGGDGVRRNVVLNHATVADRLASGDYLGGTIGRYANRIAGGRFELEGREVVVGVNDRGNSLHGGPDGFDRRLWTVEEHGPHHAVLGLVSLDGDQGFPGELTVRVRYEVHGDAVRVIHEATTDATTVVNLTNHAYLNLDGAGAGTVDEHLLVLTAEQYTPVDGSAIPVGGHLPVDGTPFDFRRSRPIGPAVRADHQQVRAARGIDHNVVVPGVGLRLAAVLESQRSGIRVELYADQPGLQVYTGNFLDGSWASPEGVAHRQGDGIALEPQLYPDTPNHPEWPSATLESDGHYRSCLEWRFSTST